MAEPQTPGDRIIVASKNPVKISAAVSGCQAMFPHTTFTVQGVSVPSGVPDQPLTDEETLQGASNRAHAARALDPSAEYWMGIEGGLHPDSERDTFQSFAWVVVLSASGQVGKARTATLYLPQELARLVREGVELGHANDMVFGSENSKHHSGTVGLLTADLIDRRSYYSQAVILALIPFKSTELTF